MFPLYIPYRDVFHTVTIPFRKPYIHLPNTYRDTCLFTWECETVPFRLLFTAILLLPYWHVCETIIRLPKLLLFTKRLLLPYWHVCETITVHTSRRLYGYRRLFGSKIPEGRMWGWRVLNHVLNCSRWYLTTIYQLVWIDSYESVVPFWLAKPQASHW